MCANSRQQHVTGGMKVLEVYVRMYIHRTRTSDRDHDATRDVAIHELTIEMLIAVPLPCA